MAGGDSGPVAEICANLRRIQENSGVTVSALVRACGYSKTQIYDIRNGKIVEPPPEDKAEAWVRACSKGNKAVAEAALQEFRELAAEYWRQRRRSRSPSVGELRTQEQRHAARPSRTVGQWNALDLGVHRAIRVAGPGEEDDDPPPVERLTAYVMREHDRRLRRRLDAAKSGAAVFAVLVGGSCTGKTRAMYEAVAACLSDWPLLVPQDAAELARWVDSCAIHGETVLWLDEAQRYLPAAASQLAILLDQVHPLAVVASMWPDYWNRLIASQDASRRHDSAAYTASRLLERLKPEIGVAERFDGPSLARIRHLAGRDSRLAAAVKPGDDRVIQHLTGGPDLVAHFDDVDDTFFSPIERAVITAALDARRLGHTSAITAGLLAEAAAGSLPGRLRVSDDPQWIDTVLRRLCQDPDKRVNGTLTALIPDRSAPGIGPADGYHPADYLDQHARRTRHFQVPPAPFWDLAARHARTTDDLTNLALAAEHRWRRRHAAQLYRLAADRGDTSALISLGRMLEKFGDHDRAEHVYEQAADVGDTDGLMHRARRIEQDGDHEGAEQLRRQAARAGNIVALAYFEGSIKKMARSGDHDGAERLYRKVAGATRARVIGTSLCSLAGMREQAGDHNGAERLYREAADAGDSGAFTSLVRMRDQAGDHDGAERLCRQATSSASNAYWLRFLAQIRDKGGDRDGVGRLYREAADAGDSDAFTSLVRIHDQAGDHDGAEQMCLQAPRSMRARGLSSLARTRRDVGDRESAERLYRQAADLGNTDALLSLAVMREAAGDRENAERAAVEAADAGDARALQSLIQRRELNAVLEAGVGDDDSIERLYRQLADAGNISALSSLAQIREKAGDYENAALLYQKAADAGHRHVLLYLADLYERSGDRENAERAAVRAADAGYTDVLRYLGEVRWKAGDRDDGERWFRLAIDLGDTWAAWFLAQRQREAGDRDAAELLYRLAVDAGDCEVLRVLIENWEEIREPDSRHQLKDFIIDNEPFEGDERSILRAMDEIEARKDWWWPLLRYGLEPDGRVSDPW